MGKTGRLCSPEFKEAPWLKGNQSLETEQTQTRPVVPRYLSSATPLADRARETAEA